MSYYDVELIINKNSYSSEATFFELRSLISEELADQIRTMMEDVSWIACTLDKVTHNHVSFTVIHTFFFYEVILTILDKTLNKYLIFSG